MVIGSWFLVLGSWFLVNGQLSTVRNLESGIWNLESGILLFLRLHRLAVEEHARRFAVHLDLVFYFVKEMIFKQVM